MTIPEFQEIVWQHYAQAERSLPWRVPNASGVFDPYTIMVSEIMLQQTQAERVIPKFESFMAQFPTAEVLAAAPLADVLIAWSGLGYNRRAKFLHTAAGMLSQITTPSIEAFANLPGIGHNTAAAIMAYAFNEPVVFIETNIRTVFIHHFFADHDSVKDADILALVGQALDHETPREWYWALMDYGVYVKKQYGNSSRRSASYTKQSSFNGSRRQLRGMVLKRLTDGPVSTAALQELSTDERLHAVISDLETDGLISTKDGVVTLG